MLPGRRFRATTFRALPPARAAPGGGHHMTAGQRARRRRQVMLRGGSNGGRGGSKRVLTIVGGTLLAMFVLGLGIAGAAGLYGVTRYNAYADDVVPPEQLIAELP